MLASDYIAQVRFLLHDQGSQDYTDAEILAAVNVARTAVAIDFQCVRTTYLTPPSAIGNQIVAFGAAPIYQPVGIIANQEAYPLIGRSTVSNDNINGGILVGVAITNGGSGYTPATTISFDPPPIGGVLAACVPVIENGRIIAANMTAWGIGYEPSVIGQTDTQPDVLINDSGGGTGATAMAVMFNNVFNVLSISCIWGNMRYMLSFRAFTLFQAYMRSQRFMQRRPVIWTIQEEMGLVLIAPPPDQAYQTEWDTVAVPIPLGDNSTLDAQVLAPANDAVQYYAAHYCLNKLQNFNQAEYMLKLYSARVPKIIIGKQGFRIPNPYHRTFQRRVMR